MANENEISIDMTLDIKDFEDQLKKSEQKARDTGAKLDQSLVLKMRLNIDDISQKIKEAQVQLKTLDQNSLEARKLRLDISQYKTNLTEAKRQLNNYVNTGDTALSRLQKKFNQISDKMGGSATIGGQAFSSLGSGIGKVSDLTGGLVTKLGYVAIALGAIKVGATALNLGDKLEQANISFETMLGSADQAKKLLSDLASFAARTPFELIGLRDTAKQLLAFGIESNQILPTLKALGDVSAGLSVPIEQVAYAFGQVKVAGRLMGGELMQFTNAGVPLIAELSKNLGVSQSEIKKLVSEGKIGFSDVSNAFKSMSSEGGKFANLMEKQTQTLSGKWSNLKDNVNSMLESLGTVLLPYAKMVVDAMNFGLSGLKQIFQGLNLLFYDFIGQIVQGSFIIQSAWQKVTGNIAILLTGLSGSFKDAVENTKILAFNIGAAFGSVPGKIGEYMNKGIEKIENFLNLASNGVNNFAKKLGFSGDVVGKVSLGRMDSSGAKAEYKEFVKTNREASAQINSEIIKSMNVQIESIQKQKEAHSEFLQNSLNEKIMSFNNEKKLDTELAGLQSDFNNQGIEGAKKSGAEKKKSAEELQKELEKQAEEAKKAELERQIDLLNKRAENDISYVKKSQLSEIEKAKKIVEINETLQREIDQLKQDSNKTELDFAKEILKAEEEKSKKIKEGKNIIQDYYDEVSKGSESAKGKIEDLKKQIEDLNKELSGEEKNKDVSIAERKIELLEREKEINQEIKELKKGEYSSENIEKSKELEDELLKIKEENLKIESVLNKEVFDELQEYKKLSKTEQIIYDFEKTKEGIELEKEILMNSLKEQEDEYKKINDIKIHLENQFTDFLILETEVRVGELNKIKKAALAAAAALRSAGISSSSQLSSGSSNSSNVVVNNNQVNNFSAKITKDDVKVISNEIAKSTNNAITGIK